MKILYFVNYFPPLIGAAAINSQKIAEYLVKLGHDIVVLAPNEMGNVFNIKKTKPNFAFSNLDVEYSSSIIKFPLSLVFSHIENLLRFEIKLRKKFNPDIILSQHHAFHYASVVGDYLSKKLKIPHIIRSHDIFLDLESRSFLYNLFVSLVHPQVYNSVSNSDICYLTTTEMKDFYLKFRKLHKVNFKIHPNGIDINEFYPFKNQDELKDKYACETIISFIGLMSYDIGIQNLIRIFPEILKTHKDTHLILIGDGPYKKNLLEMIKRLNISSNIHFLGAIPHNRISFYINNSDIGIGRITNKRQWKYMIPVKCLEYMACKKTFLTTPISKDILKNNDIGLLLDKNFKDKDLIDNLIKLIEDKSLREKLGENGLKKIYEKFQWETLMKNFNNDIKQIVS